VRDDVVVREYERSAPTTHSEQRGGSGLDRGTLDETFEPAIHARPRWLWARRLCWFICPEYRFAVNALNLAHRRRSGRRIRRLNDRGGLANAVPILCFDRRTMGLSVRRVHDLPDGYAL